MNKISYGQLMTLLFVTRLFRAMTYNPFSDASPVVILLATLLSVGIQALLVLPVIILYKKTPSNNILRISNHYCRPVGIAIAIFYGVYFLLVSLKSAKDFAIFANMMFPVFSNRNMVAIVLVLVACYSAFCGIQSAGRSSAIVFVGFILTFVVILFTSQGSVDIYNINSIAPHFTTQAGKILLIQLGSAFELPAIAILAVYVRDGLQNGVYLHLILKLLALEILVFLCVTVFGNYLNYVPFPFFKLGAYSKTQFIERFDALYLIEWVLCAVISLAVSIYICSLCIHTVCKKYSVKVSSVITSGILAVILLFSTISECSIDEFFVRWISPFVVIILTALIPLMVLYIYNKKFAKDKR